MGSSAPSAGAACGVGATTTPPKLGAGALAGRSPRPVRVRDIDAASHVAVSEGVDGPQTCVVASAGALSCFHRRQPPAVLIEAYCWGERPLGDGVEPRSDTPVLVTF